VPQYISIFCLAQSIWPPEFNYQANRWTYVRLECVAVYGRRTNFFFWATCTINMRANISSETSVISSIAAVWINRIFLFCYPVQMQFGAHLIFFPNIWPYHEPHNIVDNLCLSFIRAQRPLLRTIAKILFFRKRSVTFIYFSSHSFYKAKSLNTHHIIHTSLLAMIHIVLAFKVNFNNTVSSILKIWI
jgi:hypothetical protein